MYLLKIYGHTPKPIQENKLNRADQRVSHVSLQIHQQKKIKDNKAARIAKKKQKEAERAAREAMKKQRDEEKAARQPKKNGLKKNKGD